MGTSMRKAMHLYYELWRLDLLCGQLSLTKDPVPKLGWIHLVAAKVFIKTVSLNDYHLQLLLAVALMRNEDLYLYLKH